MANNGLRRQIEAMLCVVAQPTVQDVRAAGIEMAGFTDNNDSALVNNQMWQQYRAEAFANANALVTAQKILAHCLTLLGGPVVSNAPTPEEIAAKQAARRARNTPPTPQADSVPSASEDTSAVGEGEDSALDEALRSAI